MRFYLIMIIPLLISNDMIGQTRMRINYNDNWEITDSSNYTFFRSAYYDTTNKCFAAKVTDYYSDSTIEMVGYYSNGKRNGEFIFYYSNGQAKKQGRYLNNKPYGEWIYYFPNGQVHQKLQFTEKDYLLKEYFDSLGNNLANKSIVKWSYAFVELHSKDTILISGNFKNGQKNGVWYWKWNDGTKIITENYNEGEMLYKDCVTPCNTIENMLNINIIPDDNKFTTTESFCIEGQSDTYFIVDDMPVPLFSDNSYNPLTRFNIKLEKELEKYIGAIEETMIIDVRYQVNKNGKVEIQQITCDNEKIKTTIANYLRNSKWREGKRLGKKVSIVLSGRIAIGKEEVNVNLFNKKLPNTAYKQLASPSSSR